MKTLTSIGVAIAIIASTIYLVRAFDSRGQRALDLEHQVVSEKDFRADRDISFDWDDYLELEQATQEELQEKLVQRSKSATGLNRHALASPANPATHSRNWNRSNKTIPAQVMGTAVLLHGLTDSPYSVRSLAELFNQRGFTTFVPRLPGHGFAVGDLKEHTYQDWAAAVELTMKSAQESQDPSQPLIIAGYSNGATLALNYALDCQADESLPCPDGILLLSPAIEVSPFAVLAWLHNGLSWLPFFEKFQWESINPEVDPYKFTSFPKNAGWETSELSDLLKEKLAANTTQLPPILGFQSVVDATVSAPAVLDLFMSLEPAEHELVLYDLNRSARLSSVLKQDLQNLEEFESHSPFSFAVTVLSNSDAQTSQISEFLLPAGQEQFRATETNLQWPNNVYSLSHIALPFSPADPIYGVNGQAIGLLSPRGEKEMLYLDAGYFQRLRYNPFFEYQQSTISAWLQQRISEKN